MMIVALDIATRTGIATGNSGGTPKAWSVDLHDGLKKTSEDFRFSEILRLSHGLIETHKPEILVIEAPVGGRDASAFLIGLVACVRGCAANRGVRCEMVYPATVRKHFMGKAKTSRDFPGLSKPKAKLAIKQEIMQRCQMLGWDVPDLDSADAAACWDWAGAVYGRRVATPVGGLFRE